MRRFDVALAVVLTVWMLAEVWAEHLKPAVVVAPLMVVAGAAVAWRRLYPIGVMFVLVGVFTVQAAAGMTLHSAVSPVVALLVVSWSIGAYEERRRAVVGLILLVIGLWIAMVVDLLRGTDDYGGTDFPWIAVVLATPGVLGILFGARTRSLRAAEARTAELELERREAIAAERTRIARELHDVIAHSVSVMTVQAGAAEEMLKGDPKRAVEPVRAIQETGRQALIEMKHLVGVLREEDEEIGLAPQPGLAQVERLVTQMREAGLEVDLRIEGKQRAVPLGLDLSAYRVVQEGLTNTLKHAGGAPAQVLIRYGEHELAVEVIDEGRVNRRSDGGHGLAGMRERISIFGGTFHAGPREEGGFAVRALMPLEGHR
jgi:signal transduction histidine kinase